MSDVEQYAPGTPSWVDVSSPDPDAAAAFYSGLFGWTAGEPGSIEETGGYRMFELRGRVVAGLGPMQPNVPVPVWTTYITVADAEQACAAAREAGGVVFLEPMDVLTAGRMAVIADPQGAVFSVWQPLDRIGCEIVNEPGALAWNELATRDTGAASAFYGAVFGWTAEASPAGPVDYTTWMLGGAPVGGMMAMDENYPPGVPPNWLVYVGVEDCAAACGLATEPGGAGQMGPMTIAAGTFAVLSDPFGAVFAVIALSEEMLAA